MRSLFLKIFLWFGLTMVLVNVASFVMGVITERRSQAQRQNPVAPMFAVYAQTAADIFEKDGKPALVSYLERVENASRIHAVLFDEQGNELSGQVVPAGANELANHANTSSPFAFESSRQRRQPLAAQLVRSPGGAIFTLVGELPKPDFPRPPPRLGEPGSFRFGLRMLGQRLLPVLLVGALFCYWLARYLSTPIVELRGTTHQLADGQLTARVSRRLINRRDEIGYLGRDFNLMASRIESLVEAQRRLLGDISHELRSPLSRLGVALGLARRRTSAEETAALDRATREADRINEMIGQLLALSRGESGGGILAKSMVDLSALVREIVDDANFEARGRDRSVNMACEPCRIVGESELLRSAIENVVRNAVYYTAEGSSVDVALSCQQDGDEPRAIIRVRDRGKGIPNESLDRIFDPFFRVQDSRDRQTGGSGLGLAIAARAVRLHGGEIRAANSDDGGLIVEIELPIKGRAQ